ncbi:endoplasmic reticulum metallopeptidase 1 [Anaeramoeba flamelloides]|uniref:Vacuolar membrane protease n=1 Tax=Anaeramoeba flamelloides TaxID=1746091 RepID=A0ABQ8YI15_9EUKA|nr:endoplasmic reticulum metallopeptidase 1 [Anaeramoeba flamelloides]
MKTKIKLNFSLLFAFFFFLITLFVIGPRLIEHTKFRDLQKKDLLENEYYEEAPNGVFSTTRVYNFLKSLPPGPHPRGSEAHAEVKSIIMKELSSLKTVIASTNSLEYEIDNSTQFTFTWNWEERNQMVHMSNLSNILVRIWNKWGTDSEKNCILLSAHTDSVFTGPGMSDDMVNVGTMIELIRNLLTVEPPGKRIQGCVVFAFLDQEEYSMSGSNAASMHKWVQNCKTFVNLESMGSARDKPVLLEIPSHTPWLYKILKNGSFQKGSYFHPLIQDIYSNGFFHSGTDSKIYKSKIWGPNGGLDGFGYAYVNHAWVYHSWNDNLEEIISNKIKYLGNTLLQVTLYSANYMYNNQKEINDQIDNYMKGESESTQYSLLNYFNKVSVLTFSECVAIFVTFLVVCFGILFIYLYTLKKRIAKEKIKMGINLFLYLHFNNLVENNGTKDLTIKGGGKRKGKRKGKKKEKEQEKGKGKGKGKGKDQ